MFWLGWSRGGLDDAGTRRTVLRRLAVIRHSPPTNAGDARAEGDAQFDAVLTISETEADKLKGSHSPLIQFIRRNVGHLRLREPTVVSDVIATLLTPLLGADIELTWDGKNATMREMMMAALGLEEPTSTISHRYPVKRVVFDFMDRVAALRKVGAFWSLADRVDELSDSRLACSEQLVRAWSVCSPAVVEAEAVRSGGPPFGLPLLAVVSGWLDDVAQARTRPRRRPHARLLAMLIIGLALVLEPFEVHSIEQLTARGPALE